MVPRIWLVFICSSAFAASASAAGKMAITEYMHGGAGGEFVEFTNVGDAAVDMTGWSFDDDSDTAGSVDLSGFGIVAPGQSVILCSGAAATFTADWGLAGVAVIGSNPEALDPSDHLDLFDASSVMVDQLTYGVGFPGSIDANGSSGWTHAEHVGQNTILDWQLSVAGDVQGSHTSANGDVGNPGSFKYLSENVTAYGAGCPGSGGFVPALATYGIPATGETMTMAVTDGFGGATCLLFLGSQQGATPLLGGCTLHMTLPIYNVFPVFFLGGAGPGGGTVEIPAFLSVVPVAFELDLQVVVLDPGASFGYTMTNAVAIDFP